MAIKRNIYNRTELFDQVTGILHLYYECKVVFGRHTSDNITNRVIDGDRAVKGRGFDGFHSFIPHGRL